MSIEEQFKKAVAIVTEPPKDGKKFPLDNKKKLTFYALFKQATVGKNTTPQPSKLSVTAYYKWLAWKQCGDMTKEEAMNHYVAMVKKRLPENMKSRL